MKKRKPVIGITASLSKDERMYEQRETYIKAIRALGGEVILLPSNQDKSRCKSIVSLLDGLLIPGGVDIDPSLYKEKEIPQCGIYRRFEDEYEIELVKEAGNQKKAVLGICRGIQIINVAYGGTLYQDIEVQYSKEIKHTRVEQGVEQYHEIMIEKGSCLAQTLGNTQKIIVNTSHHQAVKDVAEGFRVCAKASDGIIEAIENKEKAIFGVQWHPERMQDENIHRVFIQTVYDFLTYSNQI